MDNRVMEDNRKVGSFCIVDVDISGFRIGIITKKDEKKHIFTVLILVCVSVESLVNPERKEVLLRIAGLPTYEDVSFARITSYELIMEKVLCNKRNTDLVKLYDNFCTCCNSITENHLVELEYLSSAKFLLEGEKGTRIAYSYVDLSERSIILLQAVLQHHFPEVVGKPPDIWFESIL